MKMRLEQAKIEHDEALKKVTALQEQAKKLEKELAEAGATLAEKELHYLTLEALHEAEVNSDSEAVRKCAAEHDAFCKADQAVQEAWHAMWTAWKEAGGGLNDCPAAEQKYYKLHDAWRAAQKQYVAAWKNAKE